MHIKKHLSFDSLREIISKRLLNLTDSRDPKKTDHTMHDVFMSGFAMMYLQDPSLLQFQKDLEDACHNNNLKTIFNVKTIPKDSQMKEVMDKVESSEIEPIFDDYFRVLQRGKHLEPYQFLPGKYLVTIDGTEYFSSEKVSCSSCLVTNHKNGDVRYHHQIVQATVVHPDCRQVIPLAPESVSNTDGDDKQDCEINAGKRIVVDIRKSHPKLGMIIVGDGLYSKQPFISTLMKEGMSFILVAKPDDHKIMMEWISEQEQLKEVSHLETRDNKGRRHVYRFLNNIPLNGNEETILINYFEYSLIVNEKTTYHNSWVTDIVIDRDNVSHLVKGGRCRWKIENECFNTLKNQGYHLEHNFGHGKKNLSMNFFLLNLLAFFMHQIFELTDLLYQKARSKFSSRREFWNRLRGGFDWIIFPDWESLLLRIVNPPLPP